MSNDILTAKTTRLVAYWLVDEAMIYMNILQPNQLNITEESKPISKISDTYQGCIVTIPEGTELQVRLYDLYEELRDDFHWQDPEHDYLSAGIRRYKVVSGKHEGITLMGSWLEFEQ